MMKKLLSLVAVALLSISLAGAAFADMVKGKVTKVEDEGRTITVKSGGKDVAIKISGSRTELEGVGDRSEIKVGNMVEGEVEGGEGKKLKVSK
jgi:hypothetical protein